MKNLINLLLLLIALILFIFVGSVGFIYSVIGLFFSVGIGRFNKIGEYLLSVATILDLAGNFICVELFNICFIKSSSKYKFGVNFETISSVLGKNEKYNTLTKIGGVLVKILNKIEKNHCKKAIKYE